MKKIRRKWEDSGVPIRGFLQLAQCLQADGGVYDTRIGRFMNVSWVMSRQYRYLVDVLNRCVLHYPRITEQHFLRTINRLAKDKKKARQNMIGSSTAKLREAVVEMRGLCEQIKLLYTDYPSEVHDIIRKANAALSAQPRECDRFDHWQADDLHAAFVKYCNECDCPMGCVHRKGMEGLLDVRCASILGCFARFALSKASKEREVKK